MHWLHSMRLKRRQELCYLQKKSKVKALPPPPAPHHWKLFADFHPAILEKTAGYVSRNGAVFEGVYPQSPLPARYVLMSMSQIASARKRSTTRNFPS